MQKIAIIEYKNIVSDNNVPFGHGKKVLYEASDLCNKLGYNTVICAVISYMQKKCGVEQVILKNAISAEKYNYRNLNKIFGNIALALKKCNADIVWFTNIDWFLLLYLGIIKPKKRVIVTIYRDIFQEVFENMKRKGVLGKIISYFIKRGKKCISLIIRTYQDDSTGLAQMYMPDYIYSKMYDTLKESTSKKKGVLCVGTINSSDKDLFEMIEVFCKIDTPLLIKGKFVKDDDYGKACAMKTDNITIENKYLDEKEYYELIATYEYVILPYNMRKYQNATSGIMREALYLDSKIIAPKKLLNGMKINGIGYDDICDLPRLLDENENKIFINNIDEYKEDRVLNNLSNCIRNIT